MDTFKFGYTIPSLDEIIAPDAHIADCGPYNRSSFVEFLAYSHCMENLEFVIELDKLLANMRQQRDDAVLMSDASIRHALLLLHQWSVIYRIFLTHDAIKEVNVACASRSRLHPEVLPAPAELLPLRAGVYELLLDSYNEFVAHTRETKKDGTVRRRRLELVPPDHHYPSLVPHVASPSDATDIRQQWDRALLEFEHTKTDRSSPTSLAEDAALPRSRNGSAGTISTRPSSRGLSIGSIVDNLKDSWSMVRKLRRRRSSNDDPAALW